jgi:dihydrofolate synthase/folylpolyglutamate synthase
VRYAEAVARLAALRGGEHAGMRPGLERIEALCEALGHPERRYALVQVGGTNGKGSVSAMLAAVLRAAGRRVGLYTSPHLVSFRERIRVDGAPIPEDGVVDGVEALATLVARLDASLFEATTALALDHFAREAVDVAVLEVGLGGRLDATTVGTPRVAALAQVDLDHQQVLGATLGAIAAEKAAIVRPGVGLALSAAQAPEAMAVIERRAREAGVPLLVAGRDLAVRASPRGLDGFRLACAGPGFAFEDLALSLAGDYQPANALLAVAAAHALGVGEGALRAGLAGAHWPGRFQLIPRLRVPGGWLVLDGAHNPGAAAALARSLDAHFGRAGLTLVLGISRDKDAAAILSLLAPRARTLVLTRSSNARSEDPRALRAAVGATHPDVRVAASAAEALDVASRVPETPILCVAGSLFLVGDVLELLGGGDRPCSIERGADSMGSLF